MHNNILDLELAISCRWSDTSCTSQQTQTHLQFKTMLCLHISPAPSTHAQHAILLYIQGICMNNNVLDCELAISCRWSDTSCTATPHPNQPMLTHPTPLELMSSLNQACTTRHILLQSIYLCYHKSISRWQCDLILLARYRQTSEQTQTDLQFKTNLCSHTCPASTKRAQHAIF